MILVALLTHVSLDSSLILDTDKYMYVTSKLQLGTLVCNLDGKQ
jgi:hypothetical protein